MADEHLPAPHGRRKDALDAGAIRYFTGKPCKFGHVSERWAKDGKCVECTRLFQTEQRDVYYSRHKRWRDANPGKMAVISERSYRKHKPKRIAYTADYYRRFPEKKRAIAARHYAKHAERYKAATRAWCAANRARARAACREWSKAHPEASRAYTAKRRAAKQASGESFTPSQLLDLLLRQGRRCAGCRTKVGAAWHADHVDPLSKGGGNSIRNIQILCPPCNQRKHAKDPLEWARQEGRLL